MSDDPDFVPLDEARQAARDAANTARAMGLVPDDDRPFRRRRGQHHLTHSPYIVNGRPADLQPLPMIDPLRWQDVPIPERRWIVPGLIPEGQVTMLGGDGGLGKSLLAIQLLVACSLGKAWLGRDARPCKAMGVFCEDDADELHRRVADVLRFYGASFGDLEDLRLMSRVGDENSLLEFRDQWTAGEPTAFYTRIEAAALEHGAEVLVLDSLHDLFAGNENSRPQARQFINELRTIARQMKGAIVLTAHPSLSGRNGGTGEAGSTAWNNAVRSRLYLTAPRQDDTDTPDRDYRELRPKKANYGANGDVTRLRWREGVFIREDRVSLGVVGTIELDRDLMDGLRSLIENGAFVPADPSAPKSFANAVRGLPSCKKYDWNLVRTAQERLIQQGRINRVEMGPKSKRRIYIRPADMTYPGEVKEGGK